MNTKTSRRITVSCRSTAETEIAGLCITACRIQNCYNVGKVTLKGTGYAAGLARKINSDCGDVTNNYSAGALLQVLDLFH